MPGFLGYELLRPVRGESRYFVYTRWETEEAFRAWVESPAFTRGHAQAAKDSRGTVAHGAALMEFEVVQKVDRLSSGFRFPLRCRARRATSLSVARGAGVAAADRGLEAPANSVAGVDATLAERRRSATRLVPAAPAAVACAAALEPRATPFDAPLTPCQADQNEPPRPARRRVRRLSYGWSQGTGARLRRGVRRPEQRQLDAANGDCCRSWPTTERRWRGVMIARRRALHRACLQRARALGMGRTHDLGRARVRSASRCSSATATSTRSTPA